MAGPIHLSSILGTSDPRVIGAVMDASGLKHSTIRPGDVLRIPDDAYNRTFAEGDYAALAATGQAALNEDNARIEPIARAENASDTQAAQLDTSVGWDPEGLAVGDQAGPGVTIEGLRRLGKQLEIGPGIVKQTYDRWWGELENPANGLVKKGIYGAGVLVTAIPSVVEELGRGLANTPSNFVMAAPLAADAGTHIGMAADSRLTSYERWLAGSAAAGELGQAILGLAPVAGLIEAGFAARASSGAAGALRDPLIADRGLATRGFRPPPGTRQIPEGVPEGWRIRSTQGEGGVWYYDPTNKGNAVRVMPGEPASPFPNSQSPYVRWQRNGQPLDVNGNVLPTKYSPDAHIPLNDFRFNPDVFK